MHPTHLDSDALMRSLEAALAPLAAAAGGALDVASDPQDAMEMLAVAPARWRVVIAFYGYAGHSEQRLGMGTARVQAVVQRAKGLQSKHGADVHSEARGGVPPMLALVELVSAWFRALRPPVGRNCDVAGFSLSSSAWLVLDSPQTRQHQLVFDLELALPPYVVDGASAKLAMSIV